jgi:hypothetical protein
MPFDVGIGVGGDGQGDGEWLSSSAVQEPAKNTGVLSRRELDGPGWAALDREE